MGHIPGERAGRLLKAAPYLLEALEKFMEQTAYPVKGGGMAILMDPDVIELSREAIAKAKGEGHE